MKKTYYFILTILTIIITLRYIDLYYIKHKESLEQYLNLTNKIIYDINNPRGRIYDRNGILLVDNVGINTVFYRQIKNNNDVKSK